MHKANSIPPDLQSFNAKLTGWFFILAAVFSVIGLKLYDPLLTSENPLATAPIHSTQIILGALSELVLAVTATGTAILFFPLLRRYRETMAVGYLSFRLLEVVFILAGILSVLTALSVSLHAGSSSSSPQLSEPLLQSFIAFHKWTFMLGPNFMLAINTFLYSFVLHQTRWVPVTLSRLGILAAVLILCAALLELFGIILQISTAGILLAIPVALYEMTLAVYLLTRGIRPNR